MQICTRIVLDEDGHFKDIIDISLVEDGHQPDIHDGTIHLPDRIASVTGGEMRKNFKTPGTAARVMVTGSAAIAEVSYITTRGVFRGTGTSKREPADDHDPVTGELLAAARAYENLALRLHKAARSRIRAQDAERNQKKTRRTKEQWEQLMTLVGGDAETASRLTGVPVTEIQRVSGKDDDSHREMR